MSRRLLVSARDGSQSSAGKTARLLVIFLLLHAQGSAHAFDWRGPSTREIQAEIHELEAEIGKYPDTLPSATPWTLGYRASSGIGRKQKIEIVLDFPNPAPVDLVAVMPATFSDDEGMLKAFGFPVRFVIERVHPDGSRGPIANFRDTDYSVSGIEPQLFSCPDNRLATGLRITVYENARNTTWWSGEYTLALSELFAFAGSANVALNSNVQATSSGNFGYVWTSEALVDGFTLFSPINRQLQHPLRSYHVHAETLEVDFDLGRACAVDGFALWPVVLSVQHNFPQASGTSFPTSIRLEALLDDGEEDRKLLYQSDADFFRPGANPFMHRIRPVKARRFRFTLKRGLPDFRTKINKRRIALGEIQLYGGGEILTAGVVPETRTFGQLSAGYSEAPEHLTDGRTSEGTIVPLRLWVEQFTARRKLERRRSSLESDLALASHRERVRNRFLAFAAVSVILILLLLVWLVRLLAARKWTRTRERIACDLHDQIGANLSSIVHSNQLLERMVESPTEMQQKLLDNCIETARATAQETRQIVHFLEGRKRTASLAKQMQESAEQILGDIEYTCNLALLAPVERLNHTRKWDLLLFFKEALNNVIKHADATRVEIFAKNTGRRTQLVITDNGRGISADRLPLLSLEARARRMQATMMVNSEPRKGAQITITI